MDGLMNIKRIHNKNNIVCPKCGKMNYTDIRKFNLMFKTFQGVTEDSASTDIFKTRNSTRYIC